MKFTQEDIEGELSDAVPHGPRKGIAARTGVYSSVLSGWLNPNDPRKSPYYTTLFIQDDLDNNLPAIGDAVWDAVCRIREANKPQGLSASGFDLVTQVLAEIRSAADCIAQCSGAIADGVVDKREAERMITALHHLQSDIGDTLKGLHRRIAELQDERGPLRAA